MIEHRQIIKNLGGIRGLARRLGHKHHTTVQGWWERNNIPSERMEEVLSAAAERSAA
ncbi:carph-isopro domain-containing protein [Sphingobium olei]|uniref:Carph-isopro domain-containing protein n=1 Tax=Sphingobium olei TaxID=420955 RepID=A0ABW3NW73_9SPHN